MPQLTQKIGPFEFVSLQGEPDVPKTRLMVDTRPGVDGIAIWDQLQHGRPFSLVSVVDVEDRAAGLDEFDKYRDKIGTDAIGIIKDGENMVALDALFVVLDVTIQSLTKCETMVGGLNVEDGEAGFLLRCRWDLVAVDNG